jgi:Subtilase family
MRRPPVRIVVAGLLGLATCAMLALPGAASGQGAPPSPPVHAGKNAEPRLDSILNDYVRRLTVESPGSIAKSAPASSGSAVAVSIHLSGSATALAAQLQAAGVLPANVLDGLIEAYVPVTLLQWVAQLPGVERVATIIPPQPDVTSQGAAVHNAPNWNAFGYTGAGVKVGIIDVGFIGYTSLIGTEVPAPAAVHCFPSIGTSSPNLSSCEANSVHGAAVAETIIDEAPGVSLYLADPQTYADLVETANWMVSQGVQVINHSVGWTWDGPGNGVAGDPTVASPEKAVNNATAGNIVWVNSSGNSNLSTFTGDWTDTNSNNFLDFAVGPIEQDDISLSQFTSVYIQIRWDDSWSAAARDLDLLLYNSSNVLVAASTDSQAGTTGQVPYEALVYTVPAGKSGTYHVKVLRNSGTFPAGTQVQLQVFSPNIALSQQGLGNHSIGNPADSSAAGMLAVGATNWNNTSTIESYSSQGPTRDNRTKPDITGADCASTVTYGVNGFCGTSQASPHVVGLAALLRQAYPSLTPAQVAAQLKAWALPRGASPPNNTWGAGLAFLQTIGGKLAFTQQPSNGNPGVALPTQPVVALQDSTGATLTGDNATTVTLSLNGAGTLTCTNGLVKTVAVGVATFAGCAVSALGTGDTITATPSCFCLTKQSASFDVTVPPNHLAFTSQPSNGVTNVALGTQPVVTVQDPSNATGTGDSTTVVTLSVGSGPPGGTLTCTGGLSKTAATGVATFAGCKVSGSGTYVIHAVSSSGASATDSASFVVTGPARQLVFTQQPSNGIAGTALGTQPTVSVKDASGAVVTTDSATSVTLALKNAAGATLTCTGGLTKVVVAGVASFGGCSVNNAGTGYAFTASSSPLLPPADSATFNVTGVAAKLAFSQQPSNGIETLALPTQPVLLVQDTNGATLTTDNTTQVTLSFTGGNGSAVLTCTNPGGLTATAVNGVVTFAGCKLSLRSAAAYGLHAASGSLTVADSALFTVTGAANKLAFTQQPASGLTGMPFALQPLVAIEDSTGATVAADSTTQVTLTLKAGSTGMLTCSGTLTATAAAGLATFSSCTVDAVGTDVLHATSLPALTAADSASFAVTTSVGTQWYFAEGFTGSGWNTSVHLLNANAGVAAHVHVVYLLDSGAPVSNDFTVPAQQVLVVNANDPAQGPGPAAAFGLHITSDIAVVAEEQMYAGTTGDFAHGTQGATALSNTWYFAEGFTQSGWQTFVLVANPGAVAASVTITYEVQGGAAVTNNITVAAGQRGTFLGHIDVPNQAFSVSVSSTQPIVAEMAMYDTGRGIAHRALGVTQPNTDWYLGEGFTVGWETYISVGNPGAIDATVTAVYALDNGTTVTKQIGVPAHSRGTFIGQDPASGPGPGFAFGVHVSSTAPVVVQEVLLDPTVNASRANSTMASPALNNRWSFSGGSSAIGMVSFYTVSNPNSVAVNVTATYYFDDSTTPLVQNLSIPAHSRGTFATVGGSPAVPSGHAVGVIITSTGGAVVAQEAVYDEANGRAYSAGGLAG